MSERPDLWVLILSQLLCGFVVWKASNNVGYGTATFTILAFLEMVTR